MIKKYPFLPAYVLMLYHLFYSFIGWKTLLIKKGDAYRYWFIGEDLSSVSFSDFLHPGTDIVKMLTYPLVSWLSLPFWLGFLIFSFISGLGFLRWWKFIQKITAGKARLQIVGYCCLLMPNLHFWTSLIGKEALIFVPLVFLTEEIYEKRYYSLRLWVCLFAIGIIRPHVAGLLIMALLAAWLWKGQMAAKLKILMTVVSGIVLAAFLYLLKEITHAEHGLWNKVARLYDAHIRVLQHTNAYVPLDLYPLPGKIFTVLFRPLPFERSGFYDTVVGIDNFFLLVVSCLALYKGICYRKRLQNSVFICFSVGFVFFFSVMYGYAYANFGLLIRTKIMISPVLLTLCVFIFTLYQRKSRTGLKV